MYLLNFETQIHQGGTASNRGSSRHGENKIWNAYSLPVKARKSDVVKTQTGFLNKGIPLRDDLMKNFPYCFEIMDSTRFKS